jgi:hypothetical protein
MPMPEPAIDKSYRSLITAPLTLYELSLLLCEAARIVS